MYDKIALIQKLWRGDKISMANGADVATEITILPRPIQAELPVWLTGELDETFLNAGRLGFNILTAKLSLGHNLNKVVSKASNYRDAMLANHGRPGAYYDDAPHLCHRAIPADKNSGRAGYG
jgi:alkanesulfonate monooxygenase SsuD/methylene tetrahydromethanopterin reductase-like flavin-dependent oxidoreductase (luciferase family)